MKNTRAKKQRKKVKVLWRDAISHAEWCYPSEVKKYKPAINTTEGYLLIKNSEVNIATIFIRIEIIIKFSKLLSLINKDIDGIFNETV